VDGRVVDAINEGRAPVVEPWLQELISSSRGRLRATRRLEEAVYETDVTFLIVPTPSESDGSFSDRYLRNALGPMAEALKESGKEYHLFVVTSTVSPGTTEGSLIPLIEGISGRKLNLGFGVCYNPEFIALGSVINDFLNPDLVLIGESDSFAGDQLVSIYEVTCENEPYIARMSIISAEITKISLNAFVTMKISFANTLANICEGIPGADIDAITKALGADKRVSPYYLKGGPAYGGPCFPRDNRAFVAFARKYGCEAKLAEATDEVNRYQISHLKDLVLRHLPPDKKVSILGLAYKPNTPVIEESAAIKLIDELLRHNVEITVYDPLAMEGAKAVLGDAIRYASSLEECLSSSACWILTLPYDEFKSIDHSLVAHNPTTVIDCWRMLDLSKLGNKVKYIPLGRAKE